MKVEIMIVSVALSQENKYVAVCAHVVRKTMFGKPRYTKREGFVLDHSLPESGRAYNGRWVSLENAEPVEPDVDIALSRAVKAWVLCDWGFHALRMTADGTVSRETEAGS